MGLANSRNAQQQNWILSKIQKVRRMRHKRKYRKKNSGNLTLLENEAIEAMVEDFAAHLVNLHFGNDATNSAEVQQNHFTIVDLEVPNQQNKTASFESVNLCQNSKE